MSAIAPQLEDQVSDHDGDDLPIAHLCAVHKGDDAKCEAHPEECESFCGYTLEVFDDESHWAPPEAPLCIVCESMFKNAMEIA